MSSIPTMEGIDSRMVETDRLEVHVLTAGAEDGTPVIFVHGNGSSATFWESTMLALPRGFRGIAPDMRGYGDTEPLPVDATRGLGDMVEDVRSLVGAEPKPPILWVRGADDLVVSNNAMWDIAALGAMGFVPG